MDAAQLTSADARTVGLTRAAAATALGVLVVIALAAAVTALAFAEPARQALDFGFGGVPRRLDEALAIFASNARLMGAVAAAVTIVQAPRWDRPDRPLGVGGRRLRLAVDLALGAAVTANAIVIGMAVGAYGWRMVEAMLPHGPPELAAFALALAVYLRARGELLRVRTVIVPAAAALALLALAALVETYAAL